MSRRTYFKSGQFSVEKESKSYENFISTLEKKIEERSNSPASQYNFMVTNKEKFLKLNYAEELKKQMEIKRLQKELEKQDRLKPAISEEFHGYPNLPQTPTQIRRQRELEVMRKVRNDLTDQLLMKKQDVSTFKSMELENAKQSNFEDNLKYDQEKQSKLQKKENERQILVNA